MIDFMKSFVFHASLLAVIVLVASSSGIARGVECETGPDGAFPPTVNAWEIAAESQSLEGTCWIGYLPGGGDFDRLHYNGARDTIVFIPANVDFTKKVDVVYWWHGLGGFGQRDLDVRIVPNLKTLMKSSANFVFVMTEMPWSINTRTKRKRQGMAWRGTSEHEQFHLYHENVLDLLGEKARECDDTCRVLKLGKTIIIGHSAGGSALKSAAKSGSLDIVKPHRIVMSDASYGNWADVLWESHVAGSEDVEFVVLVRYGDSPWKNIKRFIRRFYGMSLPKTLTIHEFRGSDGHTHRSIGDMSLLWAYSPKNLVVEQ